jgi:polyphenol oxidase
MKYEFSLPQGFRAATSTIEDGNMDFRFGARTDVSSARAAFCHPLQIAQLAVCTVEHGDRIAVVDATTDLSQPLLCDALITKEKGIGLFLLTADCIPLVVVDSARQCIALVHLGWKPTALSLAKKTIERMLSLGASVESLHVYAGPGIHATSYICENPAQRADPAWAECITHISGDMYAVDLYKKNELELRACGISPRQIHMDAPNTATDMHFFSHYRAQRTREQEGRIATCLYML